MEMTYLKQVLTSSTRCGDGQFTKRCQEFLIKKTLSQHCLLTTSCTDALEMAAILLRIQPGDEVVVPSFTFVSTANAFALHGAKIIFADVRRDTLNIDETLLEKLITNKTVAIVVVHYAGIGCNMDEIMEIANRRGIVTIEDNAHGLFGFYKGRPLGSIGHLATQSFHETKNVSCGEGGALLINADEFAERAEIIREKGTNRSQFFRGQIDKYSWVDTGSSFLPSDILAAILLSQLENAHITQEVRRNAIERYGAELKEWANRFGVTVPAISANVISAWHMFYLITPTLQFRTRFIDYLKAVGISATFHYLPLNTSICGIKHGGRTGQCPVSESQSDLVVRLPLFNSILDNEITYVIEAIKGFTGEV